MTLSHTYRLGAIFLLAFILRAGYALYGNVNQPPDAGSFDTIAWNLASQGRYVGDAGQPTAYRTPTYVSFLAAIYKFAGHHAIAAQLTQAFLGSLLVLFIIALARRVSDQSNTAWIAGLAAAAYPFLIYYDSKLIADSFLVFALTLSILLLIRWQEVPSFPRAVACGLCFSALALTKTVFIPWVVLVLCAELFLTRAFKSIVVIALCFLLPILLWGLRNERIFGRFLLDTHGGITSVETVMFYPQCKQGIFPQFFENHPLKLATASMNEAEKDTFYLGQTRQWVREHPGTFLRQILGNIKNFWRVYPRQDLNYPEGKMRLTFLSLLTEPLLLVAGALGIWWTRSRWRTLYPVYAAIGLLAVVHALLTAQMRYRLPVMALLILFAAAAIAPPLKEESE